MQKKEMVITKRNYYTKNEHIPSGLHASYTNVVKTEQDETPEWFSKWGYTLDFKDILLGDFPSGAVLKITVEDTGNRAPGRWELTEPHTYEHVDKEEPS